MNSLRPWALMGIASVALVLAGCVTPATVATTPDKSTAVAPAAAATTQAVTAAAPAESSSAAPAAPADAKMGDALTLKGNVPGSQLQVTFTKLVATKSGNEFEKPDAGQVFMAAQFRLANTGTVAYSDSPSNGAKLIDDQGQQYQSRLVTQIAAGPLLPSGMKLARGGKALGYIVFMVPKGTKVTGVQFGMDSGFGETGEWKV